MTSYFFHLAFELSPCHRQAKSSTPSCQTVYAPPSNLDLLQADLPLHSASKWAQYTTPKKSKHRPAKPRQELRLLSPRGEGAPTRQAGTNEPADNTSAGALPDSSEYSALEPDSGGSCTDWRFAKISIDSIDMEAATRGTSGLLQDHEASDALAVKGRYVPSNPKTTEFGWGVVHLYRDMLDTFDTGEDGGSGTGSESGYAAAVNEEDVFVDKEFTTLCILAVPSYMTPSDLLGWVGEGAEEDISHFRLIKTGRSNKYMVLMKFREAKRAKSWYKEWNGKPFSSMEPENCHVVFIKTIQFHTSDDSEDPSSFPSMSNDPFKPSLKIKKSNQTATDASRKSTSITTKPAPPPTPSLIELPTCPVCLERMDETNGLLTIFCQHVFHCACLQKWKGSGCPVCRYTQDPVLSSKKSALATQDNECKVCGAQSNLWICLICGHVGCGRYDEAHAFAHFKQTGHSFAMDIATQHLWDYAGDGYVHRLLQNKTDGKLVELPPRFTSGVNGPGDEMIARDKIENMGIEYTYLLSGQLHSQRTYFEEQLERAVDKASQASAAAEKAESKAEKLEQRFAVLQSEHDTLSHQTIPQLERDKERLDRRAQKFESTARDMTKKWQEEKAIGESLMDRVNHVEKQLNDATLKCSDLEEQNRDLSFFISGTEKLKNQTDDITQGTVTIADAPQPSKKKKGKSKK